jgi:hypothetical protein
MHSVVHCEAVFLCVYDLLATVIATVRATENNLDSVTRISISLYFQKNLGLLHGKHACSILERYFKTRFALGCLCGHG